MNVPAEHARSLLAILVAEGLVEPADYVRVVEGREYRLTTKGLALAQASAARPLHRKTVQRRLHELIERMVQANRDERFYVGVQQAVVFGSYLSATERLGDLDVHYTTYRKIEDGTEFMRVTGEAARASGRHFSTIVDELYWPEDELRKFLKNRSRVYSLGNNEILLKRDDVPRTTIFEGRRPVDNWRDL